MYNEPEPVEFFIFDLSDTPIISWGDSFIDRKAGIPPFLLDKKEVLSKSVFSGLTCSYAKGLFHGEYKDLSIPDFSGSGIFRDNTDDVCDGF